MIAFCSQVVVALVPFRGLVNVLPSPCTSFFRAVRFLKFTRKLLFGRKIRAADLGVHVPAGSVQHLSPGALQQRSARAVGRAHVQVGALVGR